MHPDRPLILCDHRERHPWRFSDAVDTEIVSLATGDYTVKEASDLVVVERKSLDDLVLCCTHERERFIDECRRAQVFPLRIVIVEAALEDVLRHRYESHTNPSSIIGTTVALHVDYGMPTIWAGDATAAANIAERLLVRVWRKHTQGVAA